jgi:hypothetical protein
MRKMWRVVSFQLRWSRFSNFIFFYIFYRVKFQTLRVSSSYVQYAQRSSLSLPRKEINSLVYKTSEMPNNKARNSQLKSMTLYKLHLCLHFSKQVLVEEVIVVHNLILLVYSKRGSSKRTDSNFSKISSQWNLQANLK